MNLFKKDPRKKLEAKYKRLMEAAMRAQRGGDIVKSSELHAEAERVRARIDQA